MAFTTEGRLPIRKAPFVVLRHSSFPGHRYRNGTRSGGSAPRNREDCVIWNTG